jgi:hypothetical protein
MLQRLSGGGTLLADVAKWLRHCAASWKVSGSIPGDVTGDFFPRLPMEPCALGSTQPLKMSTRKIPGGEGGRCVRVATLPPS